jgi:acyl-CoA synthetase (NDP forming)
MLAADHAARLHKPLVVVKVGRTEAGTAMAKAHTGHLTGADAVVSAVFRQFGVTRVDGLDELLDTSAAFARTRPPRGDGVCIYAISGGTGAHLADLAAAAGLRLPPLTAATQRALHDGLIPSYLQVSNPVDCGGPPVMSPAGRQILDLLVADPNVDLLICPITGALETMSQPLARDLVAVAATTDKPIFVVWGSPVGTEPAYTDVLLASATLPVFRTFANCVGAVRAYLDYWGFASRYRSPFADAPTEPRPVARRVRRILDTAPAGAALSEPDSKAVLAAYGVRSSRDVLCRSAAEAVDAARRLGYPVVMKAAGAALTHKSDLGLVAVGVASGADVRRTYADLARRGARAAGRGGLDGVLVCETVTGGVEMVVGIAQDPLFGPVVMCGFGGVLVEVLGDVAFRVPPFGRDEAARLVAELRGAPILDGVRGAKPADVDALLDVIMNVERLAMDLAGPAAPDGIAELDINPLIVRPRGAVALDALVVRK